MSFRYLAGITNKALAQNEEFFTSDVIPPFNGILIVDITYQDAEDIEITFNSGTNWEKLLTTTANRDDHLEIIAMKGDQINFRDASPTPPATLDLCRVAIRN